MGFPPPPDAPAPPPIPTVPTPPAVPGVSTGGATPGFTADSGLADDPSSSSICGFQFPPFPFFKFGFVLPFIGFPPSLPIPHIGLAINCDLNNPLSLSAGVTWGGNRAPNGYPDPDALEQAA